MANIEDIRKSIKIVNFKETKRNEPTAKMKQGKSHGTLPLRRISKTRKSEQLPRFERRIGSKNDISSGRESKVTVSKDVKVSTGRQPPGQYRFVASPKFLRKDIDENEDLLKRPASVALPHIATQRFLASPDMNRDWTRRSLPDITCSKKPLFNINQLNHAQSTTEIQDLRSFPIDKFEREHVEKKYTESQLDPVSYTYLLWLEENPQSVIKLRNHGLGSNSLSILKNSLENNNIVKELDLAGNSLNDVGIEDLSLFLRSHTHITTLDLSSNAFSSKGVIAIGNLLEANKALTNLSLSRNNLTDTDLEILCSSLEDTDNRLAKLDLSFNRFTPQSGYTLGRFISLDDTLEELDIEGNSLGPVGSWEVVNQVRNSSLQKLNIAANEISEEGIMYIGEIKDFGKNLTHLDLSDNFITKLGVTYLMPMLECNKTLNTLKLDNNLIGTNGLIYALRFLIDFDNSTLSQLYVKGTFADETVKELCTKIRSRNSKFILVGALGIYGTEGVDTMKTLQIYLKNNKIMDRERSQRLECAEINQM